MTLTTQQGRPTPRRVRPRDDIDVISSCRQRWLADGGAHDVVDRFETWWTTNATFPVSWLVQALRHRLATVTKLAPNERGVLWRALDDLAREAHREPAVPATQPVPDVAFAARTFALHGEFVLGSIDAVSERIRMRGGRARTEVRRRTDFLVYGGLRAPWHGPARAEPAAVAAQLRSHGWPIAIITEATLCKALFADETG